MVENKCWGTTEELQRTDAFSLHRCFVQRGGYCSMHYHQHRDNLFVVDTATIAVIELVDQERRTTIVPPRGNYNVKAGVPHRFVVLESGLLWEAYWPTAPSSPFSVDDIVRFDSGGAVDDPQTALEL